LKQRLQKILADAGLCSRRTGERWIQQGRISLNGSIVSQLGTQADPEIDAIRVDGKLLQCRDAGAKIYIALNKPRGYVTTLSDPEGRPTVADLIKGVGRRVYPVGRLDFMSEGLLLLTNDGELARDLMRPGGVEKGYSLKVRGIPDRALLARLAKGIRLEGRQTLPARFRLARSGGPGGSGNNAWIEASVIEGRNRLLRRMMESVGHPVVKLRRTRIGRLKLAKLPSGEWRPLTSLEIGQLRQAVAEKVKSS
jgi:pseudouridine synthase